MNTKNISNISAQLLNHFNQKGQTCFGVEEVCRLFPNKPRNTILQLLSKMKKRGLLMRIRGGMYYIIPYEKDAATFMPDWHVLAKYLVKDTEYYIGYYSALQIHNLITQPSLSEQIVVAEQICPSLIKIKETPFQFIYHNEDHFFGFKKVWIDDYNKVIVSDLEKTIIDCLFKPNYADGIVEIAKAIFMTKEKIDFDKLYSYAFQFKSQAVMKRLGYLLELLEINHPIIDLLQQQINKNSYVILDTELPREGKRLKRWAIQQNLDSETIKSAIYT